MPLDYKAPTGETIKLSVIRLTSSRCGTRLGSLFINPGGPGSSAIDFARGARSVFPEEVRAAYDVVAFDPRGVQRSEPVTCLTDSQLDSFISIDGTPDDAAEVAQLDTAFQQFAQGCEQRSAKVLGHVSTEETARDMDVLRGAMGE